MHACIDLGSNSFHLLIGEWTRGRVRIVERLSEKVQLGENVQDTGRISPEAFQRGLDCLARFRSLLLRHPVREYWALGTNTFRVAENAGDFIDAARRQGIDIATISGVQEAMLIYAGVITSLPASDARRLVIDIGGGSTEVIVGCGHVRLLTESLPVGSVAWRDRFFSGGNGRGAGELMERMDRAAAEAARVFSRIAPGVKRAGWLRAHASSGTVKMLANICHALGQAERDGVIRRKALDGIKRRIAECIAEGAELEGLRETRRDLLLPGWSALTGLMASYDVKTIRFSATALREGMLAFMVKRKKARRTLKRADLPKARPMDAASSAETAPPDPEREGAA